MQITIPKIVVPVDMSEYAPELAGHWLHVWVNPPLDKLGEHMMLSAQLQVKTAGNSEEPLLAWYSEMWSQGPEPTHLPIEEIKAVQQKDPALLVWMIQSTTEARKAHMDRKKKS